MFVVDDTENSKEGGVPAECAAPKPGYEQDQKATYLCSYLGHQNQVTFGGGISECRPNM